VALGALTPPSVAAYLDGLQEMLSPPSIKLTASALSMALPPESEGAESAHNTGGDSIHASAARSAWLGVLADLGHARRRTEELVAGNLAQRRRPIHGGQHCDPSDE
jgi:hypothetical protein